MVLSETVSLSFEFALSMSYVLKVYATFNFTVTYDYGMAALKSQEQD